MTVNELKRKYPTLCGRMINITDRAIAHLEAHADVVRHLPEALGKLDLPRHGRVQAEIDLSRVVGRQKCIDAEIAGIDDPAIFVLRKGRMGATRTVITGAPTPTSFITIIADPERDRRGEWRLTTAWIGRLARAEPWDIRLDEMTRPRALEFWSKRALLVDSNEASGSPFRSTFRIEIDAARKRFEAQGISFRRG